MAAFNTAVTLAPGIRTNTGFQRTDREAHKLVRQIPTLPGDLGTTQRGILLIALNPMPTPSETPVLRERCTSLTDTETPYRRTDMILRYAVKGRH